MKWLTEDRAFWLSIVLWLIALGFAWFTSPVAKATGGAA